MKKGLKYLFLGLALFVGLGLVACDNSNNSSSGSGSQTGTGTKEGTGSQGGTGEGTGGQTKITYKELDDCDFPAGKYMYNDILFDYNKTDKKVVATQYESYSAYKNNNGVKQFEETVKFVERSNIPSVYFKNGDYEYFFYIQDGKNKISKVKGSTTGTYGLPSIDSIVEPTYGTYVSAECEQYIVDASGNRIEKDGGGYQKEKFYIFLELTAASAKVYYSANNISHGETPLYTLDNYVLTLKNGNVCFAIPHPNGEYSCSFYVKSETVIHCTNSSENVKGGDYSMSGDLTKLA